MKVTIDAGAELDIATPAEVRREIEAALGIERRRVLYREFATTGKVGPGATTIILPTPGQAHPIQCPAGYEWDVKRISVTGQDPTVTLPGRLTYYVMASPPPPGWAGTDPGAYRDFTDSIPDAWYGSRQIVLSSGLYLVFFGSGLAEGDQISVNGLAAERPDPRVER